jgi:hypothetical protein
VIRNLIVVVVSTTSIGIDVALRSAEQHKEL